MSGDFCVSGVGAAGSYGQSDPFVRDAQQWLNDAGAVPPLQTDGIWGPKTRAALKEFQRERRLPVTGILDPATVDALQNAADGVDVDPFAASAETKEQSLSQHNCLPTTHAQAAQFSQLVYDDQRHRAGSELVSKPELEALGLGDAFDRWTDDLVGFEAALFRASDGEYYLAFSGSKGGRDHFTNVQQAIGSVGPQYGRALALTAQVKDALTHTQPGAALTVTGHSLGGGLASAAARAHDLDAVTFNAAGLHPVTELAGDIERGAPRTTNTHAYYVDGDLLSLVQDASILPNADGSRQPTPDYSEGVASPSELHSIQSVLLSLELLDRCDRP